jgi:hypothetical protein
MKRVLAVMLIGTITTLLLGIENTSWAVQSPAANQAAQSPDRVTRALSSLRRGATVEIEQPNKKAFYAVIEEIGPDAITVLRDGGAGTLTERIPIADITSIRAVSGRIVAHNHKGLIIAAVVAGLIVVGLVGACRSSSPDVRPVPNGA